MTLLGRFPLICVIIVTVFETVTIQALSSTERDVCLNSHNILRGLHVNTGPMTWDTNLAAHAQERANEAAKLGYVKHYRTQGRNYGENIWEWKDSRNVGSCAQASLDWYNEIKHYSYETTRSTILGKSIDHFTQLIWKSSNKLGVGMATGRKDNMIYTYFVARYTPVGNTVTRHYGNKGYGDRNQVNSGGSRYSDNNRNRDSYQVNGYGGGGGDGGDGAPYGGYGSYGGHGGYGPSYGGPASLENRKKTYGEEVQPRKWGAETPALWELDERLLPSQCKKFLGGPICARYKHFCKQLLKNCTTGKELGFQIPKILRYYEKI